MTNEEFIESIRLKGEEWKPVVGWEDRYAVSSYGRMAALYKPIIRSDGVHHHSRQLILKGHISKSQRGYSCYKYIYLTKAKNRTRTTIHRLVALAFIPNPNNYPYIDHIDGNGLNNKAENLRWCTQYMNMHNPVTFPRFLAKMQLRKNKPNIKLSVPVVCLDKNGSLVKTYSSMADCKKDGFFCSAICRVCRKQKPQYKGYKWMYLSEYKLLVNKSKNSYSKESLT